MVKRRKYAARREISLFTLKPRYALIYPRLLPFPFFQELPAEPHREPEAGGLCRVPARLRQGLRAAVRPGAVPGPGGGAAAH